MSTNGSAIGKSRRIAGNILIFLLGLVLVASAGAKLAHVPKVAEQMGLAGIDGWRLTFVGFLEVTSAILFLFPLTRSLGLLLVSAFLGGAIATHLEHGLPIVQPGAFLILLWLGALLRHPGILWSFDAGANVPSRLTTQEKT